MTSKTFIAAVLLAAAAPIPAVAAAPRAPVNASAIGSDAEAIVNAAYPADGPGAAAIITRNGKVIYAGGRGFADLASHRPITPDTVFELGSIAKQFTAAVILQLVHEKRISLDDPLGKFFRDWPQPGAEATVRQLLNHTSGIPDFSKIPGWIAKNGDRDISTEELLTLTKSLPTRDQPGAKWEYSNGGYVILGAVVEKVTGQSWYQAVDERIAKPLGLASLRYAVQANGDPSLATRYSKKDGRFVPSVAANMSIAGAAGGLVASVGDMAKFADALNHGKVVAPALYREMVAPARLADGKTAPYGFATHLKKLVGHPVLEHGGAGRGIDTDSAYFPGDDVFVAVFANSDDLPTDASVVLRRLGALAVGSPLPAFTEARVDPRQVEPLFGRYGGNGREMRFFTRDGAYFIASGDDELRLKPAGGDRFYSASTGLDWVAFTRGPKDAVTLDLHGSRDMAAERFTRLGPLPAEIDVKVPPAILQSYAGDYQTETLAVTVAVAANGWLTMTPKGVEPLSLRPIANDEFKTADNRMRVKFIVVNGKADAFTMYRGARELHGKRIGK